MKKLFTLLACATMTFTLTACGSSDAPSEPKEEVKQEPTSLVGTWKSEENEGSYQEAVITEDKIEINWMSPDSKALYWVGSYEEPTEVVTKYEWTSQGDTATMSTALLASQQETKDFTYENGKIYYEASAMGVTKKIELTRQ